MPGIIQMPGVFIVLVIWREEGAIDQLLAFDMGNTRSIPQDIDGSIMIKGMIEYNSVRVGEVD